MDLKQLCMGCMTDKKDDRVDCPVCGFVEGTAPESPLFLTPRTILEGKYLIGRVLGQGGFGITYLAWDINLNLKLAIKEYFPQDLASRAAGHSQVSVYSGNLGSQYEYGLDKYLQEARTLAQFEGHPSIVSVRDFFKANETAYFVMSYVEGITLKDLLKESGGKMAAEKARLILMPVIDALKEVHAVNVLHRDISPDNIFINNKGQVILIDFGAARQSIGEKGHSLSIILKPGYAPEEQYRSKGIQGPWTDIYAIAATYYHMITGHMPPEALERLIDDPLEPPNSLGAGLSEAEEKALLKALAVRAKDRFQTVDEFQSVLLGDAEAESLEPMANTSEQVTEEKIQPLPEVNNKPDQQQKEDVAEDNYAFTINKKVISYTAAIIAAGLFLYGGISLFGGQIKAGIPFTEERIASEDGTIDSDGGTKTGTANTEEDIVIEEGTIAFDGGTYTGQLVNGVANGFGTWKHQDGTIYEGEFKEGKFHGQGKMTFSPDSEWAGDSYEGEWKEDQWHGQGTYTWADGTVYEGEHKDGKFYGQGTFTWPDGARYEGEWKDDLKNGQGIHTWPNGDRYEGEYKDDLKNGQGKYTWADGDRYEGEWKDDLRNGQGTYTWANGDKHEGELKDDLFHGQGIFTAADGTIIKGRWEFDEYVGE